MSMIGNFLRVTNEELDEEFDLEKSNIVDTDKSWEGILLLLTGQNSENLDHPLSKILFSGQIIDEEQDLGYGPGHYLRPNQVKEINSEISVLSADVLKKRYDPVKMDELEIYPRDWTKQGVDVDYLLEYFEKVKAVFKLASANNEAIITFLN